MPLNVLVVGAGVCGPAFATLLQDSDHRHNITVIERSPSLRVAGQQIDLKGHGMPIMRKMSLLDTAMSHRVEENGMDFIDSNGKLLVRFGVQSPHKTELAAAVTSECEIMRGDLVKILHDAGLDRRAELGKNLRHEGGLKYEFGKTITDLHHSDNGVDVTFSDGQKKRYDIVVGADGQGSRTRRLGFGREASDEAFKSLGVHTAFYSIPRLESHADSDIAKSYIAPGRRGILVRTGDRTMTQVYLNCMNDTKLLKQVYQEPMDKQKAVWSEIFQDAGWQTDRLLSGLKTSTDFYACELGQVKLRQLYNGRVVLLGDAGYCPSFFTGMGTTTALVGSYVLAGELARHGSDVDKAFKGYEKVMRDPIIEYQKMPFGGSPGVLLPSSRIGVWLLRNTIWALSSLKIDQILQRVLPKEKEKSGWPLPEYPELNLRS